MQHCREEHDCPAHHAAACRFAEVLLQHYRPGDVVWVQDYHLMMLPQLLKQRQPKMKVRAAFTAVSRSHTHMLCLQMMPRTLARSLNEQCLSCPGCSCSASPR